MEVPDPLPSSGNGKASVSGLLSVIHCDLCA